MASGKTTGRKTSHAWLTAGRLAALSVAACASWPQVDGAAPQPIATFTGTYQNNGGQGNSSLWWYLTGDEGAARPSANVQLHVESDNQLRATLLEGGKPLAEKVLSIELADGDLRLPSRSSFPWTVILVSLYANHKIALRVKPDGTLLARSCVAGSLLLLVIPVPVAEDCNGAEFPRAEAIGETR